MSRSKSDKRVRLIEAAKTLMHQQGYNLTTFAEIAALAEVPLGNVYYYFKTKESVATAAIELQAQEIHHKIQLIETNHDVKSRLNEFLQSETNQADMTVKYGCSVGSLCQELAKQGGQLADTAAKLMEDIINWVEKQFKTLGCGEQSHELALQFMAKTQGAALLTNTFKNAKLIQQLNDAIETWVNEIVNKYQGS